MPRRKKLQTRMQPERALPKGSMLQSITRLWVTIIFLALVIYGTLIVVGRSAGFRELVQGWLEPVIGMPVTIESMRITPKLKLEIKGLRDESSRLEIQKTSASLRAGTFFKKSRWPFRALEINDARLRFFPAPDGSWMPLPELAGALLPWMERESGGGNGGEITEWMRTSGTTLKLQNVTLLWMADEEVIEHAVQGVFLETATVRPFGEDVLWSRLRIQSAHSQGEAWLRDVDIEWLRMPGQDVVLKVNQKVSP
jgi:hypothetical protein